MQRAFLEFLAADGSVSPERAGQIRVLLRGAPEPIGSIAFSYGMLSGSDIDAILDEQRKDYRPFGEIAVSKGLLIEEQVKTLLDVQPLRAATEIAEALALAGICPIEQVMAKLGQFLSQNLNPIPCTQR